MARASFVKSGIAVCQFDNVVWMNTSGGIVAVS